MAVTVVGHLSRSGYPGPSTDSLAIIHILYKHSYIISYTGTSLVRIVQHTILKFTELWASAHEKLLLVIVVLFENFDQPLNMLRVILSSKCYKNATAYKLNLKLTRLTVYINKATNVTKICAGEAKLL